MTRAGYAKSKRLKAKTNSQGGIFGMIKNKIIDKTSDVLSLPARLSAGRQIRQSNYDVQALKADRAIKGKPIEPYDESNPDFRTRMNAIGVRTRLERQAKGLDTGM